MRVAVAGGSGFIGRHLVAALRARGDEVVVIAREPSVRPRSKTLRLGAVAESSAESSAESGAGKPAIKMVTWELLRRDAAAAGAVDAVVNLAGETINQRWTAPAKRRILESRLDAAQRIAEWLRAAGIVPRAVVNASAVAAYGTSDEAVFDEASPAQAEDFLGGVVCEWERAAERIAAERLVKLRTGVVLGADGGAFPLMALPYRLGVGGRIGSGAQWLSWIHMADMVRLIAACLDDTALSGAVNATAPHPVRNRAFGAELALALHRPNLLPAPAWAFRLLFGEMAALLLDGQCVMPRKALESGFVFRYPVLREALHELLGSAKS